MCRRWISGVPSIKAYSSTIDHYPKANNVQADPTRLSQIITTAKLTMAKNRQNTAA